MTTTNLRAHFTDQDLECLAITAGELLNGCDPQTDLSTRQRELAERAYKLLVDPDHELTTRRYTFDVQAAFTAYVDTTGEAQARAILLDLDDIEITLPEQGVILTCGRLKDRHELADVNELGQ